ncbi:MAG: hypothetical protein EB101_13205 [Chitinophagia bacterium]|nr:hypothetical protein [Chitinophagia bacterium]
MIPLRFWIVILINILIFLGACSKQKYPEIKEGMEVGISTINTNAASIKDKPFSHYRFAWWVQKKTDKGIICKGGNPPPGWAEKYWTNWSKEDLAKVSYEPKEKFFPWTNLVSISLKDANEQGIKTWGTVIFIKESEPYLPVPYVPPHTPYRTWDADSKQKYGN